MSMLITTFASLILFLSEKLEPYLRSKKKTYSTRYHENTLSQSLYIDDKQVGDNRRVTPNYDDYLDHFEVKDIVVFQDLQRNISFPMVSASTGNVIPNRYVPIGKGHLYGMVIRKEKEFMDILFGDTIGRVYQIGRAHV